MKTNILVAFDLDDTLYKERAYVISGRKAVADAIGEAHNINPTTLIDVMNGAEDPTNVFDPLQEWLASRGIRVEISRMVQIYREHQPTLFLPQESAEVLLTLRNMGVFIGIITDGSLVRQQAKIEALGIDKYISKDNIVVSGDVGADKRTNIPFLEMERRAGNPSRKIYVGDNLSKDFYWPNRMGWTTIMLRDTEQINTFHQDINNTSPEFRPAIIVDKLAEIVPLITNIHC